MALTHTPHTEIQCLLLSTSYLQSHQAGTSQAGPGQAGRGRSGWERSGWDRSPKQNLWGYLQWTTESKQWKKQHIDFHLRFNVRFPGEPGLAVSVRLSPFFCFFKRSSRTGVIGQMSLLSSNQQCPSTEGNSKQWPTSVASRHFLFICHQIPVVKGSAPLWWLSEASTMYYESSDFNRKDLSGGFTLSWLVN